MAVHDAYYTSTFRDTIGFHQEVPPRNQGEFIARTVPLNREQDILDLGCGFGRHSLELATLGFQVTGLDQSSDYLTEARQAAKDRNLPVRFVQGDFRRLDFHESFDVVLSISTSLAFYDEATNLDIFRRIHKALRPGGVFFFDQGNIFWIVKNLVPERFRLDAETCVISARYVKDAPAGRVESGWDLRFYHLPELKCLLGGLGFALTHCAGEFDGSAFSHASRRLITIWQKPGGG